nr:hypothetical protein [Pandoravirus belohorizontensis]
MDAGRVARGAAVGRRRRLECGHRRGGEGSAGRDARHSSLFVSWRLLFVALSLVPPSRRRRRARPQTSAAQRVALRNRCDSPGPTLMSPVFRAPFSQCPGKMSVRLCALLVFSASFWHVPYIKKAGAIFPKKREEGGHPACPSGLGLSDGHAGSLCLFLFAPALGAHAEKEGDQNPCRSERPLVDLQARRGTLW